MVNIIRSQMPKSIVHKNVKNILSGATKIIGIDEQIKDQEPFLNQFSFQFKLDSSYDNKLADQLKNSGHS